MYLADRDARRRAKKHEAITTGVTPTQRAKKMPGIYSKPPRRAEYASDTRCLVQAATERLASGKNWEAYVHTLADEMEAERNRARREAFRECGVVKETSEPSDSVAQKKKIQQAVARKEMEVAEVFFECGVHEFFCKVLEQANEEMSLAHIEQLLGVGNAKQVIVPYTHTPNATVVKCQPARKMSVFTNAL